MRTEKHTHYEQNVFGFLRRDSIAALAETQSKSNRLRCCSRVCLAVCDRAFLLKSAKYGRSMTVIGAVKKLESSAIPLLASPQGGVSASSRKFREATEADADWVVFLCSLRKTTPSSRWADA